METNGKIYQIVLVNGSRFTPTWVHAHGSGGFVLGNKGSDEVITVPASHVSHVIVKYESAEAVERMFNPKPEDVVNG